jgi:hypothetical protein
MKETIRLFTLFTAAGFLLISCEGPAGPKGDNGLDGTDANENCIACHNPAVVDKKAVEFELSKHSYGEAAFEEAGNTGCDPCHASEAFKYVCKNNTPATFTLNSTTGKYSNDFACTAATSFGELNCSTCHSNLHSTYTEADFFPLTTTAAVSMTMWKGSKSIDITTDGGKSNLCIKCHQPRPLTTSSTLSTGDVVDYASLVSSPGTVYYDNAVGNAAPNKLVPSYRTHVHYGGVGAIFAGKGGVEFAGSLNYSNSAHTSAASCQDCHMAAPSGRAGGHTFKVRSTADGPLTSSTTWNFNGCNVTGCHVSSPITTSSTTTWTTPRTDIKNLLNSLATRINSLGGGTDILHKDATSTNLWAGLTTNNYDGYLDIYDPSSNAAAAWRNPAPSNSWTTAQKATNSGLPVFPSLKNVVIGSMINFQLCLREYSLGVHNYSYSKALLQNSIDAMTTAGI